MTVASARLLHGWVKRWQGNNDVAVDTIHSCFAGGV